MPVPHASARAIMFRGDAPDVEQPAREAGTIKQGKVGDANCARHLFCRDDCAALCVEVGQLDQEGPSREAWPEPLRNVRVAARGRGKSARRNVSQVRDPPKLGEPRRRLWRSDAPDVAVSSIEASA